MIQKQIAGLRRIFHNYAYSRAADFAVTHFDYPALTDIRRFHMSTISERASSDPVEIRELGNGLKYNDPFMTYYRFRAQYNEDAEKWDLAVQRLRLFESELNRNISENAGHTDTYECENGYEALSTLRQHHQDILYRTDGKTRHIAADFYPDNSLPAHIVGKLADGAQRQAGLRDGPHWNILGAR